MVDTEETDGLPVKNKKTKAGSGEGLFFKLVCES